LLYDNRCLLPRQDAPFPGTQKAEALADKF